MGQEVIHCTRQQFEALFRISLVTELYDNFTVIDCYVSMAYLVVVPNVHVNLDLEV